ncbi:47.7 kDa RNAse III [Spodoptera frugiperda ascovirus 1a]|uniref:47.7 kDa RNAse III n=2 Tax=Spodoptera frugiperda ascovirus 1a TaxID=113370 RepID=Q0E579_SFAVA|nr:47.7 kDa RNAse III [Spodoptera frugiperda ascovirus 1a]CAL44622.1 47.7 kDa RNAse III [Spodoptera frugiperda ascovirus 1a]
MNCNNETDVTTQQQAYDNNRTTTTIDANTTVVSRTSKYNHVDKSFLLRYRTANRNVKEKPFNKIDHFKKRRSSFKRTTTTTTTAKFVLVPKRCITHNRYTAEYSGRHWRARVLHWALDEGNLIDMSPQGDGNGCATPVIITAEHIAEIVIEYGNVDAQYYKHLLDTFRDEGNMDKFQAALTSKEYDNIFNYEYFEYIGDSVINRFIIDYIRENYTDIHNIQQDIGVMTKLRSIYVGKWNLSKCCVSIGLNKFIRCQYAGVDGRKLQVYGHRFKRNNASGVQCQPKVCADSVYTDTTSTHIHRDVISLLEDVMESFVGALWCSLMGSPHCTKIVRQFVYGVIGDYAGIVEPSYVNLNSARDRLQIASKELFGDRITWRTVTNPDTSYTCSVYMDGDTVISSATAGRSRDEYIAPVAEL